MSCFPHYSLLKSVIYSGWWFEPLWKIWVRQLGRLATNISGKINNGQPNHQPVYCFIFFSHISSRFPIDFPMFSHLSGIWLWENAPPESSPIIQAIFAPPTSRRACRRSSTWWFHRHGGTWWFKQQTGWNIRWITHVCCLSKIPHPHEIQT